MLPVLDYREEKWMLAIDYILQYNYVIAVVSKIDFLTLYSVYHNGFSDYDILNMYYKYDSFNSER
jgi:hypothetical protein